MSIVEIRAKKMMAGPGNFAYIAEAELQNGTFATVNVYDGEEYTVQNQSVYSFLADGFGEPCEEFSEGYGSVQDAEKSAYADVFRMLNGIIEKLG